MRLSALLFFYIHFYITFAIRLSFPIISKEDKIRWNATKRNSSARAAVLYGGTNIPKYALDYDDGAAAGVIGGKSEIYISISLVCYGKTRGLN